MKWRIIRHLIKLIWMVYINRLILSRVYMDAKHWYVDLYTREYYEEMFIMKEELNEGD